MPPVSGQPRPAGPAPAALTPGADAERPLDPVFSSIACAVLGAGRYTFSPDWRLPPHTVEHYRLLVAVRGAAEVRVGGIWYRLAPGTWCSSRRGPPTRRGTT